MRLQKYCIISRIFLLTFLLLSTLFSVLLCVLLHTTIIVVTKQRRNNCKMMIPFILMTSLISKIITYCFKLWYKFWGNYWSLKKLWWHIFGGLKYKLIFYSWMFSSSQIVEGSSFEKINWKKSALHNNRH